MTPEDFKDSAAGQMIRSPRGYWAFVPTALPPALEFDASLVGALSAADRALGELTGVTEGLPNPSLLSAPASHIEAVQSSRIEGTTATLHDLFLFEASPKSKPAAPDVQEVANYLRALEHGLRRMNELPISNRLIREIHGELMRDVRGGYATPGEFRTSQNWIGPPGCTLNDATFVPPPPEEMLHALADLERYVNAEPTEPPLIQAALMHHQFEAIHPFLDGNGRVGRLLITLFLCQRGHLSEPVLSLSSYFERHRNAYYSHLLEVSQRGARTAWLHFFLQGVVTQAGEAVRMARELVALQRRYRELIATDRGPQIALRIVDHLFLNPVLSVSALAKEWEVTFPTIQKGVNYLVDKNILVEITGQQRQRIYAANEILRTHRAS